MWQIRIALNKATGRVWVDRAEAWGWYFMSREQITKLTNAEANLPIDVIVDILLSRIVASEPLLW